MKFTVDQKDAKKRFDVYLSEQMEVSRSSAQHIIHRAEANVNGKPVGASYRVKIDDVIDSLPVSSKELPAEEGLLHVIEDAKDYLIVDKPAGLTVHATAARKHGTLVNLLLSHYPLIREVGEPHRPGVVHRLDRDVSGCMIVAKNAKAYEYLKNNLPTARSTKNTRRLFLDQSKTRPERLTPTSAGIAKDAWR